MVRKIFHNQLFKVLSYNSLVVFFKIISSFIVSKVSALYLGPSGFAIVGNFKNILQGLLGISSSGFESGVIKYISENNFNEKGLKKVAINIFALNLIISLLISPFLFLFSEQLAIYILKDISLTFVFKYLSLCFPLISLSFLVVYIANGLQKFKLYVFLIITSNIFNALLTFIFVYFFNLKGALIVSLLVPSLSFLISLIFKDIRELFLLTFTHLKYISLNFFKAISVYLFMAIFSSILISLSYLFIRNTIINRININNAGLWEAMNKISTFYMIFFSSFMTLYLLPKLAKNESIKGYYKIMKDYFKSILPLLILSFLFLFAIRNFIIKFLLTSDFLEISQYFYLQLIADFFKIIGFSLAYQFHAKKMVFAYLFTDTILYGVFYVLSNLLIDGFSLYGIFYAYLISTMMYFLFVVYFVYKLRFKYLISDV